MSSAWPVSAGKEGEGGASSSPQVQLSWKYQRFLHQRAGEDEMRAAAEKYWICL